MLDSTRSWVRIHICRECRIIVVSIFASTTSNRNNSSNSSSHSSSGGRAGAEHIKLSIASLSCVSIITHRDSTAAPLFHHTKILWGTPPVGKRTGGILGGAYLPKRVVQAMRKHLRAALSGTKSNSKGGFDNPGKHRIPLPTPLHHRQTHAHTHTHLISLALSLSPPRRGTRQQYDRA